MLFALLTTFLFAGSAICNTRISNLLDTVAANLYRLSLALLALGLLTALTDPRSFHAGGFAWLLLSGFVGFGVGDIGLFSAFLRIGSRLTVLINFCLGTVVGALGDTVLLGVSIAPREWAAIAVVLSGLAVALMAARRRGSRHGSFAAGIVAAVVGAFGQGMGATISQLGREAAAHDGIAISGVSQAFQRVIAGLLCLFVVYQWRRWRGKLTTTGARPSQVLPWLAGAALCGPVLGVSCFQQALNVVGSSGIVMAVVATSPLLLIPLAWLIEGDRPTRFSVIGALVGVGGVIALVLLRA